MNHDTKLGMFAANLLIAMGAALAIAMLTPWWVDFNQAMTLLFVGVDDIGADSPLARLLMGIAGGVCAGWGVTMRAVYRGASVRDAVLPASLTWFALDTAVTVAAGAWGNVVGNVLFAALFLATVRPRATEPTVEVG